MSSKLAFVSLALCLTVGVARAQAQTATVQTATVQTILMIRHGEKPASGLGQLDCQGLNRSLALPAVIAKMFGRPTVIFAPDPGQTKIDGGTPYNYIRPLATVEPTAIALGMPVDTSLGLADIDGLRRKLEDPAYAAGLALVGWEHVELIKLAQGLVSAHGGNPAVVPNWKSSDFDGIFVVRITRTGATSSVSFERRLEGLDGRPKACPAG